MYQSIFPPRPGMKAMHKCKNCNEIFLATIPILDILGICLKCPKCGSRRVVFDNRWRY